MGDTPERWYWIEGRIGRRTWVLRFVGMLAVMFTLVFLPLLVLGDRPPEDMRATIGCSAIPVIFACVVFRFVQDVKRLHDLGQPGWFLFCAFIPVINLIYVVILAFQDGQPHRNAFGPDPKRRDEGFEAVADVFR